MRPSSKTAAGGFALVFSVRATLTVSLAGCICCIGIGRGTLWELEALRGAGASGIAGLVPVPKPLLASTAVDMGLLVAAVAVAVVAVVHAAPDLRHRSQTPSAWRGSRSHRSLYVRHRLQADLRCCRDR